MTVFRIIFCLFILIYYSCDESREINTNKNTYYDDISDITYLNESFFTTNYDMSGNAGSQIDLIKINHNDETTTLEDKFDLGLNGQGFLTITNDGTDLFLQSRSTNLIFKSSVLGDLGYSLYDDTLATYWLPSGLSYHAEKDSLIFLYRSMDLNDTYLLRLLSKDIASYSTRTEEFILDNIDTTYHGVYAMAYANPNIYLLAVDDNQEDVLITMDYGSLNVISTELIADSTVVGIEIVSNSIYLSFRDKSISLFRNI